MVAADRTGCRCRLVTPTHLAILRAAPHGAWQRRFRVVRIHGGRAVPRKRERLPRTGASFRIRIRWPSCACSQASAAARRLRDRRLARERARVCAAGERIVDHLRDVGGVLIENARHRPTPPRRAAVAWVVDRRGRERAALVRQRSGCRKRARALPGFFAVAEAQNASPCWSPFPLRRP